MVTNWKEWSWNITQNCIDVLYKLEIVLLLINATTGAKWIEENVQTSTVTESVWSPRRKQIYVFFMQMRGQLWTSKCRECAQLSCCEFPDASATRKVWKSWKSRSKTNLVTAAVQQWQTKINNDRHPLVSSRLLYTSIQSQESGDGQQFKKSAVRWQLHHFTHFDLQGPVIGRKEHSSLTSQWAQRKNLRLHFKFTHDLHAALNWEKECWVRRVRPGAPYYTSYTLTFFIIDFHNEQKRERERVHRSTPHVENCTGTLFILLQQKRELNRVRCMLRWSIKL